MHFRDADEFHPQANIEKMKNGIALNDEDRLPWLQNIHNHLCNNNDEMPIIITCSALKQKYRDVLAKDIEDCVEWIHLQADKEVILKRMAERENHFMPSSLLDSQLETYEAPQKGIVINANQSLEKIVNFINRYFMNKSDIGLIGLGVMGTSLCRNIASKGHGLSIYNRRVEGKEEDIAKKAVDAYPELFNALPFEDLNGFVQSLNRPRRIMLMVNAGEAVDDIINQLVPLVEKGDVLIDCGNSHYLDTERRSKELENKSLHYLGMGVSGGEEGALLGPAMMPGGNEDAYGQVENIFKSIAANNLHGESCCNFIGRGGAGHFVKMVHNGIEYAEMQLIAETFEILSKINGLADEFIADIFSDWYDNSPLTNYLLGITKDILRYKEGEKLLIHKILDNAGNKGTGGWTTQTACDLGIAIPSITSALFARYQSTLIDERKELSSRYKIPISQIGISIEKIKSAYQLCRIINHHQGFEMIKAASNKYNWNIDFVQLSTTWTAGCIIRSSLMEDIRGGFKKEDTSILKMDFAKDAINTSLSALMEVYGEAAKSFLPIPTLAANVEYFKYSISQRSSAYIIQAQRDYFGAHTYKRVDDPSGKSYHTKWTNL